MTTFEFAAHVYTWAKASGVLVVAAAAVKFVFDFHRRRQDDVLQRLKEFRLKLFEEQRPLYGRACQLAAHIANTGDCPNERAEFWKLYWGEMCLVEDKRVEDAMVEFGSLTKRHNGACSELQQAALRLAQA